MDFKTTEQMGSKIVQCIPDETHIGKSPSEYGKQTRRKTSLSLTNTS